MNPKNNLEKILNQPSYWLESVNGLLYNALMEFKSKRNFNNTELAKHLNISKGRLSQILNDGEVNFSLEKIFEILIKIDYYPVFEIQSKDNFIINHTVSDKTIVLNYHEKGIVKNAFESGAFDEVLTA